MFVLLFNLKILNYGNNTASTGIATGNPFRCSYFDDSFLLENFSKSRAAGMGSHCAYLQHYCFAQSSREALVVDILLLIPVVNAIVGIVVIYNVAKNFGKGIGFTLGLLFLGIIFWPLLAFGDAQYVGGAPQEQ